MGKISIKPTDQTVEIVPRDGALLNYLESSGRFPPVTLSVIPLEDLSQEIFIDKFINYSFTESVLVPVSAFSCEFYYEAIVGQRKPLEGDIVVLRANGIPVVTGILDQIDLETDGAMGTRMTVQGRNLLGQMEDQDAVSLDSQIIWGNQYSLNQVVQALTKDTRIDPAKLIKRLAPKKPYLFATQPGETKLAAFSRYCEGLDIFFWMNGEGNLIVGKPDMYAVERPRGGTWFLLKEERRANVLSIRSTRNSTQIPNLILPIWNGQETVQSRISPEQFLKNSSPGPARLYELGHRVPRAVIVSTPSGAEPQDLSEINTINVSNQKNAGNSNLLQAYAKRELARANLRDLNVQVSVVGHYNDRAEPLTVDRVYRVQYDIDNIDEDMFLYEVEYTMTEDEGQRSKLFFCRQTALVSNTRAL